jgi:hypothetical protein
VLGGLLLLTGRLTAAIVAHAAVNFAGFWEVFRQQQRQRQQKYRDQQLYQQRDQQRDQQRQQEKATLTLELAPLPAEDALVSDDTVRPQETRETSANTDAPEELN